MHCFIQFYSFYSPSFKYNWRTHSPLNHQTFVEVFTKCNFKKFYSKIKTFAPLFSQICIGGKRWTCVPYSVTLDAFSIPVFLASILLPMFVFMLFNGILGFLLFVLLLNVVNVRKSACEQSADVKIESDRNKSNLWRHQLLF